MVYFAWPVYVHELLSHLRTSRSCDDPLFLDPAPRPAGFSAHLTDNASTAVHVLDVLFEKYQRDHSVRTRGLPPHSHRPAELLLAYHVAASKMTLENAAKSGLEDILLLDDRSVAWVLQMLV